jgi:hypothetical protein
MHHHLPQSSAALHFCRFSYFLVSAAAAATPNYLLQRRWRNSRFNSKQYGARRYYRFQFHAAAQ